MQNVFGSMCYYKNCANKQTNTHIKEETNSGRTLEVCRTK